jgi:CO/xanthine dehydrogenase FAD-binding subunit
VLEVEELIKGEASMKLNKPLEVGEIAACASYHDLHGSQEYKEHIVGVLLKRAFQNALSQC